MELPKTTWLVVWFLSACFVGLMVASGDQPHLLAWAWAGFGLIMQFVHHKYDA